MGITKHELFTTRQNELASIAKALGHPARIAIIQYLLKVNACIGGDIVSELPLAQPTISRHLRELKDAGIIQGTVEGGTDQLLHQRAALAGDTSAVQRSVRR